MTDSVHFAPCIDGDAEGVEVVKTPQHVDKKIEALFNAILDLTGECFTAHQIKFLKIAADKFKDMTDKLYEKSTKHD
jgi:hypothetical protein